MVCKGRQELLQGVLWEPAPAQHRSRGTARAQQDLQGVLALLREGKWRRKPLLSPLELFRLKDAFSQEEKALQFLLPAHNSLALIIAKCGSLCLCTLMDASSTAKLSLRGKEKKVFSCVCWGRAYGAFQMLCSDYCPSPLPSPALQNHLLIGW